MRINENIRAALARSGKIQREFADLLGVHEGTLCEWLSCDHEPDLPRAYTVARVLGLTVDELCLAEILPEREGTSVLRLPDWGASIRHLVDTTDLTAINLARDAGVARSSIHTWMRVGRYPRLPTALRIAEALGRGVHDLCDGVGQDQAWMVAA